MIPKPPPDPSHRPEIAEPVTLLPVVRGRGGSTALLVDDADQQLDHSGRPVPPVSPAGQPYRYKVRLVGRNAYTSTADEVLALFIDGYRPDPGHDRDSELEQVRCRGRHCIGVIVQHVASAILSNQLSGEQEQLLQRSAILGDGRDPITTADCPNWDHPEVPMLLLGDLYAEEYGRFQPPAGNVKLLWPGRADRYLHDLADLGLIVLSENPAYTSAPLIEVRGVE